MRAKAVAALFQLAPQLRVVVDLAIEDDHGIAVFGNDGLVTGFQVDDLQARGCQRYAVGFKDTLLVRPTVQNGICCVPDPSGVGAKVIMCKPAIPHKMHYPCTAPRKAAARGSTDSE